MNTVNTNTENSNDVPDLMEMSDEDFAKLSPSQFEGDDPDENQEQLADDTSSDVADDADDTGGADAAEETTEESTESTASPSEPLDLDFGNDTQPEEQQNQTSEDHQFSDTDDDASSVTDELPKADEESELAKVYAPFKADGRTIQVKTPEEVRTLMQFGVNYSRKMEEMKPYRQVLKTLENNDLLDGEKINFLIDLHKKDPAAMKKFFKDSGIDPHDLSYEDNSDYSPNDHMVPVKELELDEVLNEIRETPAFARTAKVLQDDWDMASKRILLDNPGAIKVINDHIESGIFDEIDAVMATERALGRLNGLSDLEAYRKIGDAMQEAGQFKSQQKATASTGKTTQDSVQTSGSDDTVKTRKRAASPTKGSTSARPPQPNFLDMPDDELEKFKL
jgi:hypothetical protein